ncbi:UVH6 [Symbiodinium sp. CCMP2592]|nr:UVH6 [Symbiodinium sp. CCMP2592]
MDVPMVVKVCIQRISGQELELDAEVEETVAELKARLTEKCQVPLLCQRLLLQAPPPEEFREKLMLVMKTRASEILNQLDVHFLYEMKAIFSPARPMYQCFAIVYRLIASCPSLKKLPRRRANPRSDPGPGWDALKPLLCGDTFDFIRGLQEFPEEVVQAKVQQSQIHQAESIAQDMGSTFTPGHQAKFSKVGEILCEWALISIELYKTWAGKELSPKLEDTFPLSLYSSGGELKLSLLTDVEPAFANLSSDFEHVLEAVQALAVLGNNCLDRAVPALVEKLMHWEPTIRSAACDSLKHLARQNAATAELLRGHLGPCIPHQRPKPWPASVEIMDVLVNLAGDHLHTLSWLVGVMCFADPDEREIGWSYFQSVEQYADAAQLAGLLISFMKEEEIDDVGDPFLGNVTRKSEIRGAQGMICAALAKVGERSNVVVELLVKELAVTQEPFQRARAAAVLARVAPREDEAVVKALLDDLSTSEGEHLLLMSGHLASISPSSHPQILSGLRAELKRRGGAGCQAVIHRVAACSASEDQVSVILSYLKNSRCFLSHEWPASVVTALDAVGPAASSGIPGAREAVNLAAKALCKKMISGHEQCKPPLLQLATKYGLPDGLNGDLVKGLCQGRPKVQASCHAILKESLNGKDISLVLDVIDNDINVVTRCLAVELLPHCSSRGQCDVIEMLLRLATDKDVVIKSTAIGVIGQCAHWDARVCEVLRRQLEHQDAHVRSAALFSLKDLELEHDKDALFDTLSKCLDDPASNVVRGVVQCLECLLDGREAVICQLASPLIDHGDATVREAAFTLLGKMTNEGQREALSVLKAAEGRPWPESDALVREAWDKALEALTCT